MKEVVAEGTDTSNRTYSTNAPGAIGGIICRDTSGGGGQKLWYHFDRLGNVVAVSNGDGQPAELDVMDAFGNLIQTGDGSIGYYDQYSVTAQPYHLTTKEFDPDAGLYYFNARWYDAATGRFVSRDEVPAFHKYTYVGNRPVKDADVLGEGNAWDNFNYVMQDILQTRGCGNCCAGDRADVKTRIRLLEWPVKGSIASANVDWSLLGGSKQCTITVDPNDYPHDPTYVNRGLRCVVAHELAHCLCPDDVSAHRPESWHYEQACGGCPCGITPWEHWQPLPRKRPLHPWPWEKWY